MLSHLYSFFPLLPGFAKLKFCMVTFLLAMCALLETIGIGSILPFLGILLDENFLEKYPTLNHILVFFEINSQIEFIVYFLCFFIFIYLVKSAFLVISYWIQFDFFMDTSIHLRLELFKKYMTSPYDYFLSVNSAKMMRNLGVIEQSLDSYFTPLLVIFAEFFVIFAIALLLLFSTFNKGLFLIILFFIAIYIIQFLMKKKLKYWAELQLNLSRKLIKIFHESIYGIKVIKIFGREEFFIKNFKISSKKSGILKRNISIFSNLPRVILELISISALCLIMFIIFSQNQNLSQSISTIGVFVIASFRLLPSANRLVNSLNQIRTGIPATRIIIEEFKQKKLLSYSDQNQIVTFNKTIEIKNISFKYNGTKNYVFENVNLKIKKGSCIGFVGKSGAGKSTLIDLFIGLLPPSSGSIIVDNKTVNPCSRAWQNFIGYVSQSIYLTDDSIKKNIAFGINDDQINQELLNYSIEASQLTEFVDSLPNKVNTFVGEHGVRLSGGQRQRIALARALYINPAILVFDEATSSLDSQTEMEIMSSIRKLKGEKTILIIAHRLSTLDYCDVIYEVKDRKIFPK